MNCPIQTVLEPYIAHTNIANRGTKLSLKCCLFTNNPEEIISILSQVIATFKQNTNAEIYIICRSDK